MIVRERERGVILFIMWLIFVVVYRFLIKLRDVGIIRFLVGICKKDVVLYLGMIWDRNKDREVEEELYY